MSRAGMGFNRTMKPETVARRAAEFKRMQAERYADMIRRTTEKARQEGPDSIWADMLRERGLPCA